MRKKIWLPVVLVLAAIILISLAAGYYTDFLWYDSLDVAQVFMKPFFFELAVRAVLWIFAFVFLLVNLLPIAGEFRLQRLRVVGDMEVQGKFRLSRKLLALISVVLAFFWIWVLPSLWDKVMLMLNSSPMGQVDPILGRDISWYLFNYPVFSALSGSLVGLLFLTVLVVAVGYGLSGAVKFHGKLWVAPKALKHFSILMAVYLIWFAVSRQLAAAEMLVTPSSSLFGAGYTDINVRLPLLRVLQIAALAMAVLSLSNLKLNKTRVFLTAPTVLIAISILGGAYGLVIQQFVVGPNQLARETPYLEHHIEATRRAYGLDNLEQVAYDISGEDLNADLIQKNQRTIDNIRLMDYRPLQQHYQQSQSLRLYYEFNEIDIGRYRLGDEYHQVMLALRELNVESLPDQAQTLINRHFKYTHGYGVVMSPVNRVTDNGHPTYFFRDIPVESEIDIPLERPEVYFGELTNEFVVVNTRNGEFGYRGDDDESMVEYQGTDGVELSPFRRLLYAMKFRKPILLLSDEITPDSRILYDRNVTRRIQKIAPFLTLDGDLYPVVAEGKIYWLADAYTTSSLYPYAQPTARGNYIRNSAKVVVDAYNGTVDIYKFDEDPVISAWEQVFPGLIQDRSQFPTALEDHIRYPLDYFQTQAEILTTYHMTDPTDFYNREDVWEIPVENYRGAEVQVEPYYVTMQLPGKEDAEFILMLPYTPLNRNNMIGWLAAGNDGDSYGQLQIYNFPRGQLVEGPSQIEAYINQDPDISQQLSLWDQGGSDVVRGNLLTIPVDGNILYIEPLYILAQSRSVPEMRQVIVFYDDVLVMERSLDLALEQIFGVIEGEEPSPTDPTDPSVPGVGGELQDLIDEINATYNEMEQAARDGRWSDYGDALDKLGQLLSDLQRQSDTESQPDPEIP